MKLANEGKRLRVLFAGAYVGSGDFPIHNHEGSYEVVYLSEGRIQEWREGELLDMGPGTAIVHGPGVMHGDLAAGPYRLLHVQIQCKTEPEWPTVIQDDERHRIGEVMESICYEFYEGEPDREDMLAHLAGQLDILLRRNAWHINMPVVSDIVAASLRVLRSEFHHELTMDELADLVGVSRSSLYLHFERVVGCSPADYLKRLRIKHAMFLLRHSPLPIHEIAIGSGYCSSSHLSKHLKEVVGKTPKEIRTSVALVSLGDGVPR